MNIKIKFASLIIASSLSAVQANETTSNNESFSTLNAIPASSMTDNQMVTVVGKNNVLRNFRLSNPGLYRPTINGRTVFGNAVYPYGARTSYGSPFARYQQQNTYQLMNAIISRGFRYGVNPYLSFFGRRLY